MLILLDKCVLNIPLDMTLHTYATSIMINYEHKKLCMHNNVFTYKSACMSGTIGETPLPLSLLRDIAISVNDKFISLCSCSLHN